MKNLPLVTIVTPAYNQAEYLAETIESVLAQDYPNLEYIVLDDGSTDHTLEVLRGYDGRIRYERQENMGQAKTLNRGWGMGHGSLLGYLSSDDRLAPNAISQLVNALVSRPDAAVAYGDFELIDANGRSFRKVRTEDFEEKRLCVDLVCQPGPGALFKRGIFDITGGWSGKLRQVPDFEFWLRVSQFGTFIRVPEFLAQYRVHEESASFRPISMERANEIVYVTRQRWDGSACADAATALGNAFLISARHHIQSGRIKEAALALQSALRSNTNLIFSLFAWRIVIRSLMRRLYYRIFVQTGGTSNK